MSNASGRVQAVRATLEMLMFVAKSTQLRSYRTSPTTGQADRLATPAGPSLA